MKRDMITEMTVRGVELPRRYNQIGMASAATREPKEIYLHRDTRVRKMIPENRHESGEIAKKTPRHVATPFPPLKRL